MAFEKITSTDLVGKGVSGLNDTPGLSETEMKAKFEEIVRSVVIPKYNALVDSLLSAAASASIGASAPTGITADANLQSVLSAIYDAAAKQAVTYTKGETDAQIASKVAEIGSGDMAQAVYDPGTAKRDIFAAGSGTAAGMVKLSDAAGTSGAADGVAATPAAVQSALDASLPRAGGTMTGALVLAQDPAAALEAATKQYVDGKPTIKLLWVNVNPASAFAPQTIPLSYSDYSLFVIVSSVPAVIIPAVSGKQFQMGYPAANLIRRLGAVTESGVQFFECVSFDTYGSYTATSALNNLLIPYYIYGIKGVAI